MNPNNTALCRGCGARLARQQVAPRDSETEKKYVIVGAITIVVAIVLLVLIIWSISCSCSNCSACAQDADNFAVNDSVDGEWGAWDVVSGGISGSDYVSGAQITPEVPVQ